MSDSRPQTESELVEFIRAIDVRAPDSLHRQVESLVSAKPKGSRRGILGGRSFASGPRLLGAGAIAVVAIALAIGLSGGSGNGSPSGPSLRQASVVTLSGPTATAPRESTANRTELAAAVEGVSFPYWEDRFGLRSTGARTDQIDGRTVTTVFYADRHGRQIGYAIIAGVPAPRAGGGVLASRGGTVYRLSNVNGVPVVSWLRDGHLCVVSGRGVDSATLLRLASWGQRAVAS